MTTNHGPKVNCNINIADPSFVNSETIMASSFASLPFSIISAQESNNNYVPYNYFDSKNVHHSDQWRIENNMYVNEPRRKKKSQLEDCAKEYSTTRKEEEENTHYSKVPYWAPNSEELSTQVNKNIMPFSIFSKQESNNNYVPYNYFHSKNLHSCDQWRIEGNFYVNEPRKTKISQLEDSLKRDSNTRKEKEHHTKVPYWIDNDQKPSIQVKQNIHQTSRQINTIGQYSAIEGRKTVENLQGIFTLSEATSYEVPDDLMNTQEIIFQGKESHTKHENEMEHLQNVKPPTALNNASLQNSEPPLKNQMLPSGTPAIQEMKNSVDCARFEPTNLQFLNEPGIPDNIYVNWQSPTGISHTEEYVLRSSTIPATTRTEEFTMSLPLENCNESNIGAQEDPYEPFMKNNAIVRSSDKVPERTLRDTQDILFPDTWDRAHNIFMSQESEDESLEILEGRIKSLLTVKPLEGMTIFEILNKHQPCDWEDMKEALSRVAFRNGNKYLLKTESLKTYFASMKVRGVRCRKSVRKYPVFSEKIPNILF